MRRLWCPALMAILLFEVIGCADTTRQPEPAQVDERVRRAGYQFPGVAHIAQPIAMPLAPSTAAPN